MDEKEWAAALVGAYVQQALADMDTGQIIEDYGFSHWSEELVGDIADLIDTATCTIEVDWPPRVKGRSSE